MERNDIRDIIAKIRSYHPATRFVKGGGIFSGTFEVIVPGGTTPEQNVLIVRYRHEIYEYLTNPPDTTGECWKGHPIRWVCASSGVWLCICYYEVQTRKPVPVSTNSQLRNYWTQERITQ